MCRDCSALWPDDQDRRQSADLLDGIEFATRPELAAEIVAAALEAGVPAEWVAADKAHGNSATLRADEIGYVLAVSPSHLVSIVGSRARIRADWIAAGLPASAWQRRSAGARSEGPRFFDCAWL